MFVFVLCLCFIWIKSIIFNFNFNYFFFDLIIIKTVRSSNTFACFVWSWRGFQCECKHSNSNRNNKPQHRRNCWRGRRWRSCVGGCVCAALLARRRGWRGADLAARGWHRPALCARHAPAVWRARHGARRRQSLRALLACSGGARRWAGATRAGSAASGRRTSERSCAWIAWRVFAKESFITHVWLCDPWLRNRFRLRNKPALQFYRSFGFEREQRFAEEQEDEDGDGRKRRGRGPRPGLRDEHGQLLVYLTKRDNIQLTLEDMKQWLRIDLNSSNLNNE